MLATGVAVLCASLFGAWQPQDAAASQVSISQCKSPSGELIDASLASTTSNAGWLATSQCGVGGDGIGLASYAVRGAEPLPGLASVTFTAPGTTRIVAFGMHRQLRNYLYFDATGADGAGYGSWGLGYRLLDDSDRVIERCGAATAASSGRGNCSQVTGSERLSSEQVQRIYTTKRLTFQFGCVSAGACSHWYTAPGLYDIYGDLTIDDTDAPIISFVGGRIADAGAVIGPDDDGVTLGAEDVGGLGVAAIRLSVDGGSTTELAWPGRPASCTDIDPSPDRRHYLSGVPCGASPKSASIELPATPDGEHQLELSVVDAAGNATIAANHKVTVDRLAPNLPQAPEVSGSADVGASLGCSIEGVEAQDGRTQFQWLRARADGSNAEEIAAATDATYKLTDADIGSKLLCRVTVTDRGGSASRTSALTSGPFDRGQTVAGGPGTPQPGGNGGTTGAGSQTNGGATGAPAAGTVALGTIAASNAGPSGQGSSQGPATPAFGCPVGTLVTLEGSSRLVAKRAVSAATISGAVRSGAGAPAAGVVVDLVQRVRRAGVAPATVASGVSGADGRFALKAPIGPSRDLQVITRACGAAGPVIGQSVRGQLDLRAVNPHVRNGQTVRFGGRAVGGYYGKGVGLELQVLVGRKWQDVRAVRTDSKGRFASSYRFKRTYVRFTYRFRVVTRATAGWPYAATRSPVAKVRVN